MSDTTVLVAGIGNTFLGDDGFGVEVARRLLQQNPPEGVRVVDFGIASFDLAFALLEAASLTILVDACQRGGPPGALYTIDPGPENLERMEQRSVDGNRLNLVQVLRMAKAMGAHFGRILLVGCEPAMFEREEEGLTELSPAVAAAVDRAIEIIRLRIIAAGISWPPVRGIGS